MDTKKVFSTRNIALTAIFLALVIVLQYFGSYIKIGTITFSFVLVPIVLGSIVIGPINGAILGLGFGVVTVIMGLTGYDAFTNLLIQNSPVMTVLVCIVKAVAAGYFPGLIYKALCKKNSTVALYVSALSAPILNTGIFILGMLAMAKTVNALFVAEDSNIFYFLFIQAAGINFLVEFAINLLLVPVLSRVIKAVIKE